MTRIRHLTILVACLLLSACNPGWNQAYVTADKDDHQFAAKDYATPDKALLQSANDSLSRAADPNQPVMTVPGRPGGGSMNEVKLPKDQKGGKSVAAESGEETNEPRQPIELQFVD